MGVVAGDIHCSTKPALANVHDIVVESHQVKYIRGGGDELLKCINNRGNDLPRWISHLI